MILAPVLALFLGLAPVPPAREAQASVDELAARIERARDEADPRWFEELALLGGERSLRALLKSIEKLKKDELRAQAVLALRHYARDPVLGTEALEWLRKESARGQGAARKRAAVRTLAECGDPALLQLEAILARKDDPVASTHAADALAPLLGERGDLASLELVLAHASLVREPRTYAGISAERRAALAGKPHAAVVAELLRAADPPGFGDALVRKLRQSDAPRAWKLLALELLAERPGSAVALGLVSALRDPDAEVALAALGALAGRSDAEGYEKELRALLRASDPALRRAAVIELGRLSLGRPEWPQELLQISNGAQADLRMGAAAALADLRTPAALERLHAMLADKEWTVRVEALEQLVRLRRRESVPVLIERLDAESGRVREDVHTALRNLCGLDLGRQGERWQRWWAAEGASAELPSAEAALKAERERRKSAGGERSGASAFWGAAIQSERLLFVIDTSGSMGLPPGTFDETAYVPPGAKRRLDIAKAELTATLRGLEEDRLFNLIFFDSEVRAFSESLVRMRDKSRAQALRFLDGQIALGATAMYPALQLAFRDPLVDTLYVLTDGAPTVGELTDIHQIRAEVARWNATRKVRIHAVAMGIDSDLLRWLAEDTGGSYQRVD